MFQNISITKTIQKIQVKMRVQKKCNDMKKNQNSQDLFDSAYQYKLQKQRWREQKNFIGFTELSLSKNNQNDQQLQDAPQNIQPQHQPQNDPQDSQHLQNNNSDVKQYQCSRQVLSQKSQIVLSRNLHRGDRFHVEKLQQKEIRLKQVEYMQKELNFRHKQLDFQITVFSKIIEDPSIIIALRQIQPIFTKKQIYRPVNQRPSNGNKMSVKEKNEIKAILKEKHLLQHQSISKLSKLFGLHWCTTKKWIFQDQDEKKERRLDKKK